MSERECGWGDCGEHSPDPREEGVRLRSEDGELQGALHLIPVGRASGPGVWMG